MLQKISDLIKSELQSMLKNRHQSLDPAGGWRPRLAPSAALLQSPNVSKLQ